MSRSALPGHKEQAPVLSVALYRDSKNLVLRFNSYGGHYGRAPGRPFDTTLESFGLLAPMDANVIWIAEREKVWYAQHERLIMSSVADFIQGQGIRQFRTFGTSAGAYAAVRIGAAIALELARREHDAVQIRAIGINPQTECRRELIEQIASEIQADGWKRSRLGINPPLPKANKFDAETACFPHFDLSMAFHAVTPPHFQAHVFYDSKNPIDRVCAEDLADVPFVSLHAVPLGMLHADGGLAIWRRHLVDIKRLIGFGEIGQAGNWADEIQPFPLWAEELRQSAG